MARIKCALLLFVALLIVTVPVAAQASTPIPLGPDQIDYQLDLDYTQPHALQGTQTIHFRNPFPKTLHKIWLRLWANGPGGCARQQIHIQPLGGAAMDPPAVDCTTAGLTLIRPVSPGATGQVKIYIRVQTPKREDRFGRIDGVDFWSNALPVLAVHDEMGWHTQERYSDLGESFYQLSSHWQAKIKTPRDIQIATTGTGHIIQQSASTRGPTATWMFNAPHARDFMISAGRMKMISARQDGVLIRLWATPRYFKLPFNNPHYPYQDGKPSSMLFWAKKILHNYNRWFGYYNKPELDILVGVNWPAMEFSDIVSTTPGRITMAHEIAHQWWYSMVGNDQYRWPWLDESFAEYSMNRAYIDLWPQYLNPCPDWQNKFGDADLPLDSNMGTWESNRFTQENYGAVVYGLAGCKLLSLTQQMGTAATNRLFHDILSHYRYKVITQSQMIAALRRWSPTGVDINKWLRDFQIDPGG